MAKKSFLNKITGKKVPQEVSPVADASSESENQEIVGEVDYLWMKEDLDAEKPKLEKNPKIDTGILRNRIADKLSKMNNN